MSGILGTVFSMAGAGFSAMGEIEAGRGKAMQLEGQALGLEGQAISMRGTAAGLEFSGLKSERAAEYGRLNATQVGGQLTRELNETLGNIDAIRAAAHTDPTSPTGVAVRAREEGIGLDQKGIKVNNILAQATQSDADAAYYRQAATTALLAADKIDAAAERTRDAAGSAKKQAGLTAAGGMLKSLGGLF